MRKERSIVGVTDRAAVRRVSASSTQNVRLRNGAGVSTATPLS